METKKIPVKKLVGNTGQIAGLPKNPRFIRDRRFEALKKSLLDDPEMLDLRELIVYPHGHLFVVVGGNMRLEAGKEIGLDEFPCKVLPADTSIEKLRAYTIKDNVSFGQDDEDLLAEWPEEDLEGFGMELGVETDFERATVREPKNRDAVGVDGLGTDFSLKEGDREPVQTMSFILSDEQVEVVKRALSLAKSIDDGGENFGTSNGNGNALYLIVSEWEAQKVL